jgi:asparagine synthase (glutamine-hydrolysing)
MCGIAGAFYRNGFSSEVLLKMSRRMRHRGPDGEGFLFINQDSITPVSGSDTTSNCFNRRFSWLPKSSEFQAQTIQGGFVHRRLAIISTDESGHQPMSYDERYWITYNGEIYNYLEIRSRLEAEGFSFQTESDTEVILAAYKRWGKSCLDHFNGMWAFCIFDSEKKQLFAARDRFGVKPFYFHQSAGKFLFASEYKVLLASGAISTELNEQAVFDYFVFSEIEYQPHGFFEQITELNPGHWLTFDLNSENLEIARYYSLPFVNETSICKYSFEELIEITREKLLEAIRIRLRADVEVGSCLSGGLDSSTIVGMMRNLLPEHQPLHVFTAMFPGKEADESAWARQMAGFSNAISHEVEPTADMLLNSLDELSLALDLPIWSTSTFAQFSVMKLVQEKGLKVVLDGQGGDELFGGYAPHLYFFWKGLEAQKRRQDMHAFGKGAPQFRFKQWLRFEGIFKAGSTVSSKVYRNYFPGLNLLNSEFYSRNTPRFNKKEHLNWTDLNSRLAWEIDNSTLKAYLRCEDRCSMWHSVESRTPFADDHVLAEWLFSLPGKMKIVEGTGKVLLREAAKPYLPNSIYNRRDKKGYTTPNNEWIRKISPEIKDLFGQADISRFIDLKKLDLNYNKFFQPSSNQDDGRIFKFISFASWYKGLNKPSDKH